MNNDTAAQIPTSAPTPATPPASAPSQAHSVLAEIESALAGVEHCGHDVVTWLKAKLVELKAKL